MTKVKSAEHAALGRTIRELRARRDLSQEQMGEASLMHRNYVGAIERGEINPTFSILQKISRGLSIPLSEIFALYEHRRDEYKKLAPRGRRPTRVP